MNNQSMWSIDIKVKIKSCVRYLHFCVDADLGLKKVVFYNAFLSLVLQMKTFTALLVLGVASCASAVSFFSVVMEEWEAFKVK